MEGARSISLPHSLSLLFSLCVFVHLVRSACFILASPDNNDDDDDDDNHSNNITTYPLDTNWTRCAGLLSFYADADGRLTAGTLTTTTRNHDDYTSVNHHPTTPPYPNPPHPHTCSAS